MQKTSEKKRGSKNNNYLLYIIYIIINILIKYENKLNKYSDDMKKLRLNEKNNININWKWNYKFIL